MTSCLGCDETLSGWYVIYTKPRQETRAFENLRNQGFDCFCPTLTTDRLRNGRRVQSQEPLFPRYLFVRLEVGRSKWAAIRNTRGVVRLVEFGGVAARVSHALIGALMQQRTENKALFENGDRLMVVDGPFAGIQVELLRLHEAQDGEMRVIVLMDILARTQQINLPANAVQKVA